MLSKYFVVKNGIYYNILFFLFLGLIFILPTSYAQNLQECISFTIPQKCNKYYYLDEWWTLRKYNDTLYYFSEKGIYKYNPEGKIITTVHPFYWRINSIKGTVMRWPIKSLAIRAGYQVHRLGFCINKFNGVQSIPLSFSGKPLRMFESEPNNDEQKLFLTCRNTPNIRYYINFASNPEFFVFSNKIIFALSPFDSVPDYVLNRTCYLHQLDNSHYQPKYPRLSIHTFDARNFVVSDSNNFEGRAEKNYLSPPTFIGHIDDAESLAASSNLFYPYPNSALFAVDTVKEQVYIGSFSLPQIQVCNLKSMKEEFVSCVNYFSAEQLSQFRQAQTFALPKPIDSVWEKKEVRYWEKRANQESDIAKYFSVINMQLYYSHSSGLLYRLQKQPDSIYNRKQISTWVKRNRFKYVKALYDKPAFLQILDPEKPGALLAEIPVPPHFRILDTEPGGIIWAVKEINKKEIIVAKYRLDLEGLRQAKGAREE